MIQILNKRKGLERITTVLFDVTEGKLNKRKNKDSRDE